jgi:hypothetical protein
MTKPEIAKDTDACLRSDQPPGPRRGTPKARWAMVQHRAGLAGPLGPVRVLIIQDDLNLWLCENGDLRAQGAGDLRARWSGPAAGTNVIGGTYATCGWGGAKLVSAAMYAVDNSVAFGQIRLVHHGIPGPWQNSQPARGFVHLGFAFEEHDAYLRSVSVQIQFVSKGGRILRFNPDNRAGQRIATFERGVKTCAQVPFRKPVKRPANDAAGIKSCAASARVDARSQSLTLGSRLRPRLVVSTPDEWGAVLSDGCRRFGCSLYPTPELGPIVADKAVIDKRSFSVALAPIIETEGESIWASGRVPTDVTKITYGLPGGQIVDAQLNKEGYWMLEYLRSGSTLAPGKVRTGRR